MKISITSLVVLSMLFLSLNVNTPSGYGYMSQGDQEREEQLKVYSKYDFVAGNEIIFEDNQDGEQVGEFPSRWDLVSGNVENAMLGDETVISLSKNRSEISPLMDTENYLPEIFTIEVDVYFYQKYNEAYYINLKGLDRIDIRRNKVSMGRFSGAPGDEAKQVGWHHIALSFNKRALKVYFNQTRVLNIPNIKTPPTSLSISALSHGSSRGDPAIFRNIRIAEGGVQLYDRLSKDGKIVTRGILFDSGKSTIKPESMGTINEIVKLMKDHPEIRFSIEGHTDSDGAEDFNQTLSEQRADAVKTLFVELGVDESRLQTKGHGESAAVDTNSTAEGKANNRRVEFVEVKG